MGNAQLVQLSPFIFWEYVIDDLVIPIRSLKIVLCSVVENCSLVCKEWNRVVYSVPFWKYIIVKKKYFSLEYCKTLNEQDTKSMLFYCRDMVYRHLLRESKRYSELFQSVP